MPTERELAMLRTARAAGISSREETANFMAQISAESRGLTALEERFNYTRGIQQIPVRWARREGEDVLESARLQSLRGDPQPLAELMYGGRMGNDDPGDGYRYRGRGYIQLTGRDNYRAAGNALGLELERDPDLAAQPDNAARVAVWFWQQNVPLPDRVDVLAATRRVNGGTNGLDQRRESYDRWHATLTPQFLADLDAGRLTPEFHAGHAHHGSVASTNPLREIEQLTQRIEHMNFYPRPTSDLPDYLCAHGRAVASDGVLRQGESGYLVRGLQEDLNRLGITDGRGRRLAVDETFGRSTREGVENFQLWNGLPTTGVADQATLAALRDPQLTSTPARPDDAADLRRDRGLEEGLRANPPASKLQPAASHDAVDVGPPGPGHRDHAMFQQVRAHVHRLDAECGRTPDEVSDRLTASLMCLAKQHGMSRVDHVLLSERTENGQLIKGENVFIVHGALNDPAHHRARMSALDATNCPEKESYRKLESLNLELDQQLARGHHHQEGLQTHQAHLHAVRI